MLQATRTRPVLSVVAPVFNEEAQIEELLRRTLAALRGRTWSFEVVLVDDGSTDGSLERMEEAVRANPGEVVCVVLNRNYGQHAALLAGFEEARGDLIVTLDDATSTIYSAFLVEEEGTASTFRALLEVLTQKGLPASLYTDRGSHYFFTPTAGEAVDKERLSSRAEEFHLRALPEPYVSLSTHTAPDVRPLP